jgi:hypothetical protein
MAELVNLNRARKAKGRAKKRAQADENALKFGLTKAQKAAEDFAAQRARSTLDAHKREEP